MTFSFSGSGSIMSERTRTSSLQAYNLYETRRSITNDGVDPTQTPSFEELNPYNSHSMRKDKRWQPVQGLSHSHESMRLRQSVGQLLYETHQQISAEELEVRANTPEFKVLESDWVAHNANNQLALIKPLKTVARLPVSLLVLDERQSSTSTGPTLSGFLHKRGETNKAFKKRYMELNGSVLSYYRKVPEKNGVPLSRDDKKARESGSIDLDSVSSLQPLDSSVKGEEFGVQLVTTSRTWILAADSQGDFERWVKAMCEVVKFSAIHIKFKRMFQLQEVSSRAVTDVRMVIPVGDTVGEVVEHIFNCYQQALDAAPLKPYDPSKFLLKVTGFRDYMIDRYRVVNEYMHVRECLLTNKTLRLTVIHESVIQETANRSLSIRPNMPIVGNAIRNELAGFADNERPGPVSMTTLGDADLDSFSSADQVDAIPSGNVDEPVRVRVKRILNIPREVYSDTGELRPIKSTSVVVRVQLFDGGQLIDEGSLDTQGVRLIGQSKTSLYAVWSQPAWHEFPITVGEITKSMRMQFTVLGTKKSLGSSTSLSASSSSMSMSSIMIAAEEKILISGINLFDVSGHLAQGEQYIRMLDNRHNCTTGPVPHVVYIKKPMINIDLSKFDVPIEFNWDSLDDSNGTRYKRRSLVRGSRSTMLHKEGWLRKVGQFKSLTKWRPRWFVCDQETCSLSYAADESAPRKVVPLKHCSVNRADDMNNKFTTGTKGTRKERQTWCFKVRPQNSSRDYIMSAATKQEREEWMMAILTVSKGEGANQDLSETIPIEARPMYGLEEKLSPVNSNELATEGSDTEIRQSIGRQRAGSSSSSQRGGDSDISELRKVILEDPLYPLSPYQKARMWKHRDEFIDLPEALPRILSCVHWGDKAETDEALQLLPKWPVPANHASYLELLKGEFANEEIRRFAVHRLAQMADTTFSYFLPQLVQALKYENHHRSPLALHLIERAIKNPNQIGFDLFWSMKVESHHDQYFERYGTLLNAYLDVCSSKMRDILKLQDKLFSKDGMFDRVCQEVKGKNGDKFAMHQTMEEGLEALNEILPSSFQLPIDPRIEVGKIVVSKCRVMDSAKKPLWLVFENAENGGEEITVMYKAGDDVRQDCLTLQLVRLMDEMWRDEGLDLAMEPYKCVATSPMTGIVQIVPNSVTTAQIQKREGILGAFKDPSFSDWIKANNPDKKSHKAAVDLYSRSVAGYCVATFVLGIGDRHNDNIMMQSNGRYFHIDFGHFLGHLKYFQGTVKRERTPFVFTKEMAHVFGGMNTEEYNKFAQTACTAYNIVRKHMHLLAALLELMVPADMPELSGRDDINHLIMMLNPEASDEEAARNLEILLHICVGDKFKRLDNMLHIVTHLLNY